jgi:DHA3 family tetracycline resistance protein-like MFS transporter
VSNTNRGSVKAGPDPRFVYRLNGFMQGVAFGAFGLVAVVWWVVDLEFSPLRLIVLGTVMEGMVLLSESPTGVVADVFSRKWSIVASWVIMGTAQILTPISELLWVILIWQALWGFGYTFQSGADTAWVTDEIGEEDDSLVMSKAAAMAVGVIFGILTAMVLTRWSVTGAVSASGVVALMFAAWLAVRMPETNFTPVDRSQRSAGAAMLDTWRRGFGLVRRVRVTRILIIATVIVSMVNELVDRLDFLRMRELGFPELDGASSTALFGAVWIFMILLELPIMIYFSRRSEVPTDRRSALLMVSMFALAALGIAFMATNFFILALLGWVMRDVFREVVEPVGEAWFNRYAESDIRATVISFRTQSMAFGEIFGGLCLGLVAEILSVQLAFVAGAALMSLAVVQVGRLLRVETPA